MRRFADLLHAGLCVRCSRQGSWGLALFAFLLSLILSFALLEVNVGLGHC